MPTEEDREEPRSSRDDIEAAISSLEAGDTLEEPTLPEGDEPPISEAPPVEEPEVDDVSEPVVAQEPGEKPDGEQPPKEKPEAPPVQEKYPVGLPLEAKEVWKNTPPEVRAFIDKRERDFAQGIQRYAEAANWADKMAKTLRPFQPFISANSGDPIQAVGGIMQTASVLQMGSPVQKAQTVLGLIQQFGVDGDVLASLIEGSELPPDQVHQQSVQAAVAEALRPYQGMMQNIQNQQQQSEQQSMAEVQGELEAFIGNPKNEFYSAVANDMSYLLELSVKQGEPISLEQAYEKACALNPQVQAVLQGRQRRASDARKRQAAVSLTAGDPGGGEMVTAPTTRRGAIEAAFKVHEGKL